MRRGAIKVCVFCNGSGVIHNAMEYPDLMSQQWCLNCDTGQSKADRVEQIIRRSLPERRPAAA